MNDNKMLLNEMGMDGHNEKPDHRENDHTDFEESCRIDQMEDERNE